MALILASLLYAHPIPLILSAVGGIYIFTSVLISFGAYLNVLEFFRKVPDRRIRLIGINSSIAIALMIILVLFLF